MRPRAADNRARPLEWQALERVVQMNRHYESELIGIIKSQEWLMTALKNVHDLRLPDSYIAAGAIRNTVWNHMHNYPTTSHQKDVDVVYFDSSDRESKKEKISEELLKSKQSNLQWDVVNQAGAHLLRHGANAALAPVRSSCESIAYWIETATCVGVRLEDDGAFTVCAPHGLDDLMNLVVSPVPEPYLDLPLYKQRVNSKNWDRFWPRLKIIG